MQRSVAYKQTEMRRHCGAGKYAVDLEYKCNEKGCAGIVVQQTAERDQQLISSANKHTGGRVQTGTERRVCSKCKHREGLCRHWECVNK